MEDSKAFKSVLDATKTICEFIAGEHSSVFRRLSGATFGVSVSFVSVRIFEKTPDLENLEERTDALFGSVKKDGAKILTVKVFSTGTEYAHYYDDKGKYSVQRPNSIPYGSIFLIKMEGKKDIPLKNTALFRSYVEPVIASLLDESAASDLFLNGERITINI